MTDNCLGFEYLPHSVVLFSAEWVDKRGAFFDVGDTQKYSFCRARYRHGHPVAAFGKEGQDL